MLNGFKKTISAGLLITQFAFIFPASAAPETQTAESSLLANMIALRGTKISPDDRAKSIEAFYANYDKVAPLQDRSVRLGKALVDMRVLNSDQSAQFIADAHASDEKLAAGALTDDSAIQNELQGLTENFSNGAEFGGCNQLAAGSGIGLMIAGFAIAVVGVYERQKVEYGAKPDFALGNGLLYGGFGGFAVGAVVLVAGSGDCL